MNILARFYRAFEFICAGRDSIKEMFLKSLNVMKEMVSVQHCNYQGELCMHLGGVLSTQEARVALSYRLGRETLTLLSCLATYRLHPELGSCMLHVYHFLIGHRKQKAIES